jgi:uncharacterized protein (TIGR02217 family)
MSEVTSFVEMRFPTDINCGSIGGPEYSTNVITTVAGYEQRNMNWSQARRKFNIAHGIRNKQQLAELVAFFHNCRGKAIGFRFKDWSDYTAKNQLVGIGDAQQIEFQLYKTYESKLLNSEIIHTYRKLTKPVEGSVSVWLVAENMGGSLNNTRSVIEQKISHLKYHNTNAVSNCQTSKIKLTIHNASAENTDAIIDYTTGVLLFKKAPTYNTKIFAKFEFDVPVRFDTDHMPVIMETEKLSSINDISLIELRM